MANGVENLLRFGLAAEKSVDPHHGHTRVLADFQHVGASLFDSHRARHAQKPPDGVFDVVAVDGLVGLELLSAVVESAGIVIRNAALPMPRFGLRPQFQELVKILEGLWDVSQFEMFAAPPVVSLGDLGIQFDGLVEILNGLGVALERLVNGSAEKEAFLIFGVFSNRLPGQVESFSGVSLCQRGLGLFQ